MIMKKQLRAPEPTENPPMPPSGRFPEPTPPMPPAPEN